MSQPRKQHDQRVILLDNFARRNPQAFRFRLIALAVLGYAAILMLSAVGVCLDLGVISLFSSSSVSIFVIAYTLVRGFFGGVLTGSMIALFSTKLVKPDGIEIRRQDCPELFAMIDRVAGRLNARVPHHVLLYNSFNASHTQQPRFGVWGWQINTIKLGMPLLQMLSCAEVEETIAHEIGHRSGNHGRFMLWLSRPGDVWTVILGLPNRGFNPFLAPLRWFARWYIPLYDDYQFVQQRAHEYLADRAAAHATSAAMTVRTLIKMKIGNRLIDEVYGPRLRAAKAATSEAPSGVRQMIYDALRETPSPEQLARWWTEACNALDDPEEEHPCLRNRLANVGYLVAAGLPQEINDVHPPAAEFLLQPSLFRLLNETDTLWRKENAGDWKKFYDNATKYREQWSEADQSEASGTLTPVQARQRAFASVHLSSTEVATPYLKQALDLLPRDGGLHCELGEALLKLDDASGVKLVERSAELAPILTRYATEVLQTYWMRQGDYDCAAKYKEQLYSLREIDEAAEQERVAYKLGETVETVKLVGPLRTRMLQMLAAEPDIIRVLFLRKKLQHFPRSNPCYVLFVESSFILLTLGGTQKRKRLLKRIKPHKVYPAKTFIFVGYRNSKMLKRYAADYPECVIYSRPAK